MRSIAGHRQIDFTGVSGSRGRDGCDTKVIRTALVALLSAFSVLCLSGCNTPTALLTKWSGKDLWVEAPGDEDLIRLSRMAGHSWRDYSQPRPWHVWEMKREGTTRYVMLLGKREDVVPGNSSACLQLFDGKGARINNWCFQTGYRSQLVHASMQYSMALSADLIVLHMQHFLGRPIAKEFYAIGDNRVQLVRVEDIRGKQAQAEYIYPDWEIGIMPQPKTVDEWIRLLESQDKSDVLSGLIFLGGRHLAGPDRRSEPEEGPYAPLFMRLISDPRIQEIIGHLRNSHDPWIAESARLAARGPRERPLF